MKIKSLFLKNFRAYTNQKVYFDNSMNVLIGRNDIGKSTILEALDIFFGQEVIKIDISDFNNKSSSNEIIIGVEFEVDKDFNLIIDTTNPTTLKNEYLLNSNGYLEIYKKYDIVNGKLLKEKVFLKAHYPSCYETPLVNLKITNLKSRLSAIKDEIDNYDEIDKTKSADIRQALYLHGINSDTNFELIDIDLQKDDGKNIWITLQKELPLFFLFQSDRQNRDSDGDIQNPLKSATKQIISSVEDRFEELKKQIEEQLAQIGQETINKMKDMGLDIANNLKPIVNNKNWDSLFSFTLESDDGIALNKRGSGFRRMVLLNYFRAEAEREANKKNNKYIIYALEEPETAQHPNHQKLLISALKELSEKKNYQLILTTHTPEVAKMVKTENLIFIDKEDDKIKIIQDDNKLEKIANALGIHPYYQNKVVVCVEGEFDIKFLKNINKLEEYQSIVNLDTIDIIPMQGSNLKNWVQRNYLKNSNVVEVHIYDRDTNSGRNTEQYKESCEKVNNRDDPSCCFLTKKREMENYIHISLIEEEFQIKCDDLKEDYDNQDIPSYLKQHTTLKDEKAIKGVLNGKLSSKITKEHLIEINAYDEIKQWFEKIAELKG